MNIAKQLKFVNPDLLSYLATVITIGAAFFYFWALKYPEFLLWAIVMILVRMFLNKLDGAVAAQRGNVSLRGKIVNALPDRYSDIILIFGLALSALCDPFFALLGLASMFLVSYTGLLGKALEVDWQNQGPLGKVERLVLLIFFTLLQYVLLINGKALLPAFGLKITPLEWCMVLFFILGQITVVNRIRGMRKQNIKYEWLKEEKYKGIGRKILIAYDSETGTTERVAEEISNCLKVGIRRIDDITTVDSYDLVIFGSWDSGSRPSQKVIDFIGKNQNIKNYAVFITYKNPLWGIISSRLCFSYFKKLLNKKPLAVFSCKASDKRGQLFRELPTDPNLLNAFLFGVKLTAKLRKVMFF